MKSLVILSFLSLSLAACSSGSNNNKLNESCKSNWVPGTIENSKAKEKVDASDSAKSLKMNAGDYTTQSVRLFFYDKSENIRLDITVKPNAVSEKDGTLNYSLNCVRGVKLSMDNVSVKLPYVSKVNADASGATVLSMSELTLTIDPKARQVIQVTKVDSSNKKSDSLKDVYPKDADTKHMLYKLDETNYESRVQLLGPGRKDTKAESRSLTFRAYIQYVKDAEAEAPTETPVVLE